MVRGQHPDSQTRAQRCIQEAADDCLILKKRKKKKKGAHFQFNSNSGTKTDRIKTDLL